MKKIMILGCMFIFGISCKAQTIIPVEKTLSYMNSGGIPDGIYLKDVNNLLSRYMGTWKGTFDNKNYTFVVTKFKDDFLGISEDKLLIRYLITTPSGAVIENTLDLTNDSPRVIKGSYFSENASYYVSDYAGSNSQCGNKGTVFIRMKNAENTQMSFTFEPDKIIISEDTCPGLKLAELTFPRDGMMLTKE